MSNFTLHDLEKRVRERAQASADVSYTRKLIDRGAPGVHFYTLNQAPLSVEIWRRLGL